MRSRSTIARSSAYQDLYKLNVFNRSVQSKGKPNKESAGAERVFGTLKARLGEVGPVTDDAHMSHRLINEAWRIPPAE